MSDSESILHLLKRKAARAAVYGTIIAYCAIIVATLAASYLSMQSITLESITHTQKTNPVLWLLDLMPFVFAIWGQYVGSVVAREADALIVNTTFMLRNQTAMLRRQIEQVNKYDKLTHLPNRNQFLQELGQKIQKVGKEHNSPDSFIKSISNYITKGRDSLSHPTVVLLGIDNFQEINSALGSRHGDALLQQISSRLQHVFQHSDMLIARINGDDFALLESKGRNEPGIIDLAKQLRESFNLAFNLNGIAVMVDISIGISIYPQHGDTAEELLQHAEVAMYMCRKQKREYTFYTPKLDTCGLDDLLLKTEIHRALENNELCLHFQPKINCRNQVKEVEALVRWKHPKKGLIPPDKFIPIIVQKRLNRELLQCILSMAFAQARAWKESSIALRIALNLTAFDLMEPDLPDIIEKKLREYDLKANVLKLEITETTLVENQEVAMRTLTRLHEMGIPTSIDDFGTGYSSLSYLSTLPIDEIKIDRTFVMDMINNRRNDKIVQAIIALAHSLSLDTVAEGVEDARTMGELKKMDCDFLQGYHISRPLNAKDFTAWLKTWEKPSRARAA